MEKLPAALNVVDVCRARLAELEAVDGEVGSEGDAPRHLRRRARSHSLAGTWRRTAEKASSGRSRRSRRRGWALIEARDPHAATSTVKYLETHVYHAKRFEMGAVGGGWTVAIRRRDRGCRAAARSWSTHCVAWDATFERCFEVSAVADGVYETRGGPVVARRAPDGSTWLTSHPRTPLVGRAVAVNRFRLEGPEAARIVEQAVASPRDIVADDDGVDVFAPPGRGRDVWHALVMAGAHPVGLAERRHIDAVERGRPFFPDDYDGDDDGSTWARLVTQGKGVPKAGDVLRAGKRAESVGIVTTAAFALTLGAVAGIARVDAAALAALPEVDDSRARAATVVGPAGRSIVVHLRLIAARRPLPACSEAGGPDARDGGAEEP